MKKTLLSLAAMAALTWGASQSVAIDQNGSGAPGTDGSGPVGISRHDGVIISGTDVLVTRNGVTEKLVSELMLPSGVRVGPDGNVKYANGKVVPLRADQLVTLDGALVSVETDPKVNTDIRQPAVASAPSSAGQVAATPSPQGSTNYGSSQSMPQQPPPANGSINGVGGVGNGFPVSTPLSPTGNIPTTTGNSTGGTVNPDGSITQPDGSKVFPNGSVQSVNGTVVPAQNGTGNQTTTNNVGTANNSGSAGGSPMNTQGTGNNGNTNPGVPSNGNATGAQTNNGVASGSNTVSPSNTGATNNVTTTGPSQTQRSNTNTGSSSGGNTSARGTNGAGGGATSGGGASGRGGASGGSAGGAGR